MIYDISAAEALLWCLGASVNTSLCVVEELAMKLCTNNSSNNSKSHSNSNNINISNSNSNVY